MTATIEEQPVTLDDVIAYYQEEPRRIDMTKFVGIAKYANVAPPCGTVSCIAGTIVLLAIKRGIILPQNTYIYAHQAAEIIGLPYIVADRLFYLDLWPDEFAASYKDICDDIAYSYIFSQSFGTVENVEATQALVNKRLDLMTTRINYFKEYKL